MAQFLAVDWDETEIRYVQAQIASRKVTVRAIGAVPLELAADAESGQSRVAWGESLAAELNEQKLGKPHLLLSAPRRDIELLTLNLPPAKDDELPELVANQAVSESPMLDENWALDFVSASDDQTSPRQVTAVAVSPDAMAHIAEQATAAGLKAERILFRPFAATSLLNRVTAGEEPSCLLVNCVGSEVDLSMLKDGKNVLSRTVRLPGADDRALDHARLFAEITRTFAVVPMSPDDEQVDVKVCVLGSPAEHQDLLNQVTVDAGVQTEAVDPFVALQVPEALRRPDCGRFAALLGMLLDQAADTHALDFLHPRKSRPKTNRWRIGAIAAGAVSAVALLVFGHVWMTLSEIEDANREMYVEYKQMDATMKKIAEQKKTMDAIAAWKGRDVNWLDELRDLSIRFPGPRDAIVLRMSMRFSGNSGGLIDLQGLVRDPKVLGAMEYQVRDQYRRVRSRRLQERSLEQDYTWMYETSMNVARRPPSEYDRHPPSSVEPAAEEDSSPSITAEPKIAEEASP